MKLRRLRLEHFKRFREPFTIEGFADGLNLFAAPNESGKSTIAEAIRAAFFERHRSGSVEHLRPWGDSGASPTVEVVFDIGEKNYRLTKVFLHRKRCDLVIDDRETLDGNVAEDHLAALLGFKFPGKGASAPEHMGIPGLLWIEQGTSHELSDVVSYAADHLRQVLGESLGDLASSGGDALLRAVETDRNELLTPAGGSPRGDYQAALNHRDRLAAEVESLERDVDAYRHRVDQLAGLRREHDKALRDRPWDGLRTEQQRAQKALEDARGLEARLREAQSSAQQCSARVASLQGQLDGFAREEAALAKREEAVVNATRAQAERQADVDALERQHQSAVAAEIRAREQRDLVRAAAVRAEHVRAVTEIEASLAMLEAKLGQARAEAARATQLQAEAARLAVTPADLEAIHRLSDELREVTVRLDAAATALEFDLAAGRHVRMGSEEVRGRARLTVVRRTEIDVEGVGRIVVTPGGTDLHTLASRRDEITSDLRARLARLGVENVAAADARTEQSALRLQEARASRKVLEALAPQGLDALEVERARSAERLAELRSVLGRLPAEACDAAPLRSPEEAEDALDGARAARESTVNALNEAKIAAARAQSDLTTALQELAAARADVENPQRAERIAETRKALQEARTEEDSARLLADSVSAALRTVNVALLRQDAERLTRSAEQALREHEHRRDALSRLEGELTAQGKLGQEEQLAELRRDFETARRRAGELARRAAALDYLLSLLREKRAELARRLRAPLQKHLDRYLNILFPGATIEVADDLAPGVITRAGPRGRESGEFEDLSLGTREQMGIVARLAYADLLQDAGKPTLLILDDALVHTDEDRLGQMKRVLYDAASRHQVLIFTCHPAAWRDLGVAARTIGT